MNTCNASADLRSAGQNKPCYKEAQWEKSMCLWVRNLISNIFSFEKYETEKNDSLLTTDSSNHIYSAINEEGG